MLNRGWEGPLTRRIVGPTPPLVQRSIWAYATIAALWFPIGAGGTNVFKKPGHKGPNRALDQRWIGPTILLAEAPVAQNG
jgi:hypothetical protein